MRKLLAVTAIGLALATGAVQAQTPKMPPAQDKIAMVSACEKLAGNKKGDERKTFLASCVAARSEPQQSRMSTVSASSSCHHGSAEDL